MANAVYINNSEINSPTSEDTGVTLPFGDHEFSLGFTLTSGPQNRALLFSWGVNKSSSNHDQLIVFFDRQPGLDHLFIGWGDDNQQSYCWQWIISNFRNTDGSSLDIFDLKPHKFLITKPDTNSNTNSFTFDLNIDGNLQTASATPGYPQPPGVFTSIQKTHSENNQIISMGGESFNSDGEASWGSGFHYDFSGGGSLSNIILWDVIVTYREYLDAISTPTATGAACSIVPKNFNLF